MKKFFSKTIVQILILGLFAAAAYFINVEVQSYWGRQAVEETGLVRHQLDEAITKARAENKQIFVDVSAIWCPTCRKLDKTIFSDNDVKNVINKKFVFVRLEYESDEGQKFLEEHQTTGFPNLWTLDENGKAIKQLRVTFDKNEFINQLNNVR